jgi:hypothetical protein
MPVKYITVTPLTNLFLPATRSFGDIAIIGAVDDQTTGPRKTAVPITNPNAVTFNSSPNDGKPVDDPTWFKGALAGSVRTAFAQSPGPTTVWAIATDKNDAADVMLSNALAEAAKLTVQIVVLANTPLTSTGAGDGKAAIEALAAHCNSVSTSGGDGKERIGIAMLGKGINNVSLVTAPMAQNRMIMIAHHSSSDAAAAVAGVMAGYPPHISLLLKPISLDMDKVFSDAEIDAFNNARINWVTRTPLLPGQGFYLGEAYTLGTDQPYVDIVRTIDQISFALKAALIRSIGVLRVTRAGLRALVSQMSAVLQPLQNDAVIDSYLVYFPLLTLLDKDPNKLIDAELRQIHNAQAARTVASIVTVDYAGAIHRLNITLKFE